MKDVDLEMPLLKALAERQRAAAPDSESDASSAGRALTLVDDAAYETSDAVKVRIPTAWDANLAPRYSEEYFAIGRARPASTERR